MGKIRKRRNAKKVVIRPKKQPKIKDLRAKANDPTLLEKLMEDAKKPREKQFKFGPEVVKFCVYMMEKYGDDYDAMVRDEKNYYQDSAGQIKKKIQKFKSIPRNYNSYLKACEMVEHEAGVQ